MYLYVDIYKYVNIYIINKNKKVAHEANPSVSLMFLPHFDVFCNLLPNQTNGNMESICFI